MNTRSGLRRVSPIGLSADMTKGGAIGDFQPRRFAEVHSMTGGRIVALIFAVLLLLPGGCILVLLAGSPIHATSEDYQVLLPIVAASFSVAALLFWVAFRRRR